MKMNFRKAFYLVAGIFLMAPMVAQGYSCIAPLLPPGCTPSGGNFAPSGSGGGWDPGNYGDTGLPGGSVAGIVENIAFWLLALFGFIGVIGFIIAGIFYLTAAGDAEQEKKAKLALTMSIIGVIVGLLGLIILKAADALLQGGNSTF